MPTQRYRIVVRGRLSERLGSAFPDVTLERGPGRTVLRGDQQRARLETVLTRLTDLGIEPIEVNHD